MRAGAQKRAAVRFAGRAAATWRHVAVRAAAALASFAWRSGRAQLRLTLLLQISRIAVLLWLGFEVKRPIWRSAIPLHVALLLSALAPPGAAGSSSSLCSRSHTLLLGTTGAKLSVHQAQCTGLGLVQIANLASPTSQMIADFEPKRALLYSRLALVKEVTSSNPVPGSRLFSFFAFPLLGLEPAAINTRILPSRSGLPRACSGILRA